MCGRLALTATGPELAEAFGLDEVPLLEPRYNAAPTQEIAVVRLAADRRRRRLDLLRWGLVPAWAKDAAVGSRLINARAESVATRPAFRDAFRERRCLIPATGFFEWRRSGPGARQPFLIRRKDGRPFAFAGLWESWWGPETALETCVILTTAPNEVVAPLHDRMPVVLAPADYTLWLDARAADRAALARRLGPAPADDWQAVPVSARVNSPRNDDPDLLAPIASPPAPLRQRRLF